MNRYSEGARDHYWISMYSKGPVKINHGKLLEFAKRLR